MASTENVKRPAINVFVATTVMLSFISFWRAAAIVLADLASSAYYVGGDAEQVIGKSAPWFILGVMLFSYAVRSIYIESSAMFVRGGVYRVVKEAMGGTMAKLSVSALLFDYVLTGPISSVSAGQYFIGFVSDLVNRVGIPLKLSDAQTNHLSALFAILVTIYFWWKNTQGMHESSDKALKIMKITTVMVVILIGWCLITIFVNRCPLPPLPSASSIIPSHESLGWLFGSKLALIPFVIFLVGFGHSVLAMSGEESLAQVYREIEHPKVKNLEKAGLVIFLYSLLFTSLVSFFAVMIIPDAVRKNFYANLISGLAMNVVGPYNLRLVFQGFVVLVGALILSGAVNTAIVGANGVLNRISEDGVLTPWFRKPHPKYGTSYRLINMIVAFQLFAIVSTHGDVYLLASLYAFGVIWSFSFNGLSTLVLRFTERDHPRDFKVPMNVRIKGFDVPIGIALVTLLLFLIALVNMATKPLATISGVAFSLVFLAIFTISERITLKQREGSHEMVEQFRVTQQPLVDREEMKVRPGNILVGLRDPHNLYYLEEILSQTDTNKQDVVVMTARIFRREASFSSGTSHDSGDLFETYEQELFTQVVAAAEKAGKHVELMVVPSSNVFDALLQTAQRLESSKIVSGLSNRLSLDEQGKLTGDAWERLPEPKPRLKLEIHCPDHSMHEYRLGPHTPRLRREDTDLLHRLWLHAVADPELASIHHYHIVHVALERFEYDVNHGRRDEILRQIEKEMHRKSGDDSSATPPGVVQ
jgi:amino acid transporter